MDQLNEKQLCWSRHNEIHLNLLFADPDKKKSGKKILCQERDQTKVYQRCYQVTVVIAHHSDLLCLF